MSYYLVLVFFMALFIAAFGKSNIGVLIALEGGAALKSLGMPEYITLLGIVVLSGVVNIFIGSASATTGIRRRRPTRLSSTATGSSAWSVGASH
jgi:aminobenzoyl-glutamate transport protein